MEICIQNTPFTNVWGLMWIHSLRGSSKTDYCISPTLGYGCWSIAKGRSCILTSQYRIRIHKSVVIFHIDHNPWHIILQNDCSKQHTYNMKYFLFLSCESVLEYLYLHCRLRSLFLEVHKLHNLSHDKAFLEVRVYLARCLRGLRVFLQRHKTIYNCVLPN